MDLNFCSDKLLSPFRYLFSLGRWFYLLHALVFLLFFYPYFEIEAQTQYPWVLTCLNSAVAIAMIYAVSTNFNQLVIGCSLGMPVLISYWIPTNSGVEIISVVCTLLLYGYTMLILASYLIYTKKVQSDEVFGVASLYLLLGISWTFSYQLIELIVPGSFYINQPNNIDGLLTWSDFLYYSFVTITTLGYGEITPITSPARSLAMMEAVTGVMFVAVMIARIVSLSLNDQSSAKPSKEEKLDSPQENLVYRDIKESKETQDGVSVTGKVKERQKKEDGQTVI